MLALGIIVPVLPALIVAFKGGNTASAAAIYGLFGSVWAAMQFLCSPVLGSLSDRFGRRRVILLSNVGLGLDYVLMAVAPSLSWLFVGRMISGITSSSFSTAGAYIADVTPPDQRAAKFGMLGAAFGVGFIVGPSVGGLLGSINLRAPFWGAAALSLANATYGFFILPESLPPERRAPFAWRRANPIGAFEMLRSQPVLFGLANPALQSLMTRRVGPSEQGRLQGAQASLMGIASMAAPIIFTQTFAEAVGRFRSPSASGAPFLLAAALLVAALVTGLRAESGSPTRPGLAEISLGTGESVRA
jgi:DHA1 family tetracycline resistance protein-like MFS transporter